MAKRNSRISFSLLVLTACGGASLKDFSQSGLELDASQEGLVRVTLGESMGGCQGLGTVPTATLNGVALTLESPGGQFQDASGWTCRPPSFTVPQAAVAAMSGDAVLVLTDGELTVKVEAPAVFGERGLTLSRTASESGAWRFEWTPETDTGRTALWRLESPDGTPSFGDGRIADGFVEVELPQGAPSGVLSVEGQGWAQVSRCEGVASCHVRVRARSGALRLSGAVLQVSE